MAGPGPADGSATTWVERLGMFRHGLLRHGPGFLMSGIIALFVDMGVTSLLTRGVGIPALIARLVAIKTAMVVAWLCHRTLTFKVTTAPTLAEFGRYAAVAWTSAGVNYALYAAILLSAPWMAPEIALVLSSLVAMAVSYVGMRFGVFGR